MFGLGFQEILIIGGFIVIFFYGSEKLLDFARSAGKLTGEYKKSKAEAEEELSELKKSASSKVLR